MNRNTFDDIFDNKSGCNAFETSYINIKSINGITTHDVSTVESQRYRIILNLGCDEIQSRHLNKAEHDLYLGKILYQVEQAQNNPCTYREKLVD